MQVKARGVSVRLKARGVRVRVKACGVRLRVKAGGVSGMGKGSWGQKLVGSGVPGKGCSLPVGAPLVSGDADLDVSLPQPDFPPDSCAAPVVCGLQAPRGPALACTSLCGHSHSECWTA